MEFQLGNTSIDITGASPFSLSLEEGTYNSVCQTWGSYPAAVIKTYLENTELLGRTEVAAVESGDAGPWKVYNVENRNTINFVKSNENKILECVSVVYNDTVMKENISFEVYVFSGKL